MEEEKKVSDESIVEEAKGETPEETTTEEGTETQETKETKTKKKKKSAAALEIELKKRCQINISVRWQNLRMPEREMQKSRAICMM